ncbi:MAG: SDR family NAD(P)-dependent oxidoreductase, partial [Gammaproteobacteria bacterium]|nr:SDR family NAD(P)-dependent oxidoreductase [Gammaproteobacteria bacterium]
AQVDELYLTCVPDLILIAHGALIEQSQCQNDIEACAQSLTVNAVSPALFAEAFATHLEQRNRGTLAIISSVAGDRGRRSNYVYGAAKGLLNRYAQGLQHRFAGTGVNIALIKPGPTATPMTAGLLQQGQRMASAEQVAAVITTGLNNKKSVIYAPGQWRLIMMIIRHLPAFVFNRLNI